MQDNSSEEELIDLSQLFGPVAEPPKGPRYQKIPAEPCLLTLKQRKKILEKKKKKQHLDICCETCYSGSRTNSTRRPSCKGSTMKQFYMILFVIGFIFLLWILTSLVEDGDRQKIYDWAKNKNHVVKNIERRIVNIGPFWYTDKSMRVYKVDLENSKVVWFRFGFKTDIVEE